MFLVPSFTLLGELAFLYLSSFYPGVSSTSPAQRHNWALRPGLSQQQKSPESRVALPTATAKGTCQIPLRTRTEPEHHQVVASFPPHKNSRELQDRGWESRKEGCTHAGWLGTRARGLAARCRAGGVTPGTHPAPRPPAPHPQELQLLRAEGSSRGMYFKGHSTLALYASCPAIRPALTGTRRNAVPRACDSATAQAAEGPPRALSLLMLPF